MLLVLVMFLMLGLIGIALCKRHHKIGAVFEIFGFGLFLFLLFILTPIIAIENRAWVAKFEAVKATLEAARQTDTQQLELTTIQKEVIKYNAGLAKKQYYNRWYLNGLVIPDIVDTMEPIK